MDWGAFTDPGFWKGVGQGLVNPEQTYDTMKDYGKQVLNIPSKADQIADATFGGASARDSSTMNAFRHSLGTGMLTQALGGGPIAAAAAKGIGYGWEGLGLKQNIEDPDHFVDTKHDLNANAIGAKVAQQTANQDELVKALKALSLQSVPVQPPGVFEPSPGYLTRTVQ